MVLVHLNDFLWYWRKYFIAHKKDVQFSNKKKQGGMYNVHTRKYIIHTEFTSISPPTPTFLRLCIYQNIFEFICSFPEVNYRLSLKQGSDQLIVSLYTYTIYLSLCTQSANPNPIRDKACRKDFWKCNFPMNHNVCRSVCLSKKRIVRVFKCPNFK